MSDPGPKIEYMTEVLICDKPALSTDLTPCPGEDPAVMPTEHLEARICELAGHLTAATCQFLLLIADFDARQGWATWEMPSCAAWLSWKCQIASGTAREHVRVARALGAFPLIRAEFAAGRLSYAKARALTRIATPGTEADLAEMATPMTANQLERFAQAHRRVTRAEDADVRSRRTLTWRTEDDKAFAFTGYLPPAAGAVVLQAIRAALGDLEHPHHDEDADGVSAETPMPPPATAPDPPVWHPAYSRRCHLDDGPAISPAALRLIGCNATISTMIHDTDGNVLNVGRRSRKPPAALRRAVRERDGSRCQYPGCESRRTDAHHIQYWSNGGETSYRNLCSLCSRHHKLVHDTGILIAAAKSGFAFYTPQGSLIPASPPLPEVGGGITGCHHAVITPSTIIPPHSGERLDLHLAIWICLNNARNKANRRQDPQTQTRCA
jgi:5-methylcytosine-specific restriction endonuclease McrA